MSVELVKLMELLVKLPMALLRDLGHRGLPQKTTPMSKTLQNMRRERLPGDKVRRQGQKTKQLGEFTCLISEAGTSK